MIFLCLTLKPSARQKNMKKTVSKATTDGLVNRPGHRGANTLHEDKAGRPVHTMAVALSAFVASIRCTL